LVKNQRATRIYPFLVKKPLSSTIAKESVKMHPHRWSPVLTDKIKSVLAVVALAAVMTLLRDCGTAAFYAGVWKGKHTPQQSAQVQAPRTEASGRTSGVVILTVLSQLEGRNPN